MNDKYMNGGVNLWGEYTDTREVARGYDEDMSLDHLRELLMKYGYKSEKPPIERQREKYNNGKALKCKFD